VYELLHWVSDALLALPFAVAAIWSGRWFSNRLRLTRSGKSTLFARACVICAVFALLLVPGAALHDEADTLTHAHAFLSITAHTVDETGTTPAPLIVATAMAHALADGLEGQVVALPLLFAAFLWRTRRESWT
jgi:hypothetical protein